MEKLSPYYIECPQGAPAVGWGALDRGEGETIRDLYRSSTLMSQSVDILRMRDSLCPYPVVRAGLDANRK